MKEFCNTKAIRKFHIRPDGKLGRCSATKRKCRYSELPHFDNFEEGQKFLDCKIESENKLKRLEEEKLVLQKQKRERQIEERFEDWIYLDFEKISFKELREEYSDNIPVSVFAKNFIKGNCISKDGEVITSSKRILSGRSRSCWDDSERYTTYTDNEETTNLDSFLRDLEYFSEHYLSAKEEENLRADFMENSKTVNEIEVLDYYGSSVEYEYETINFDVFEDLIDKYFKNQTIKL